MSENTNAGGMNPRPILLGGSSAIFANPTLDGKHMKTYAFVGARGVVLAASLIMAGSAIAAGGGEIITADTGSPTRRGC
jgi:hypothetical protein